MYKRQHLQRAELARGRSLEALQDAAAAFAGLRRGLEFREAQTGSRPLNLYRRLTDAALYLSQLEAARHGSARGARARLRALVEELEAAGDEGFADLVKDLTMQIDEFDARDEAEQPRP